MVSVVRLSRSRLSGYPTTRLFSTSSRAHADYTNVIAGAGAVGLAIARKLAQRQGTSTLLLERRGAVGTETSSRNSEVIHAGIYYGPNSLKTELCVKGKQMMYELCKREGIPYSNCKKWIVAQDQGQMDELVKIQEFTKSIDVPTRFLSLAEAREREPDVLAREGVLESPTTGIIDSHAYMAFLESDFQSKGGDLACHAVVESVEPLDAGRQGWWIQTRSGSAAELETITAANFINSAGLTAVPLSNSILPSERHLKPYYAKGTYYSYSAPLPKPKTLIYPAPKKGSAGLGTHLTMDLTGAVRFGPDIEWVDDPNDLSVNDARLAAALDEIEAYLPGVRRDKVQVDYCGIRPKLGKGGAVAGSGDGFSDFVIRKEPDFEGFVNLLGIESPGLTSSLAIAEMVDDLLNR